MVFRITAGIAKIIESHIMSYSVAHHAKFGIAVGTIFYFAFAAAAAGYIIQFIVGEFSFWRIELSKKRLGLLGGQLDFVFLSS